MRARSMIAAAGAVAVALSPLAQAAPAAPKPQVTDVVGDANGANGQGFANSPGVSTGPASVAGADISAVTFAAYGTTKTVIVKKKKTTVFTPQGFTVTLDLAGAPITDGTLYRVQSAAPTCTTFWFQYGTPPTGETTILRHNCVTSDDPLAVTETVSVPLKPAAVGEHSVTWTVPLKALPKGVKVGTLLSGLGADIRVNTGVVTAPMFDEATSSATYRIGS